MKSIKSIQKAVKMFLLLILTLGLLFNTAIPLAAEAPATLNALILEAKAVDLSGFPVKYADTVRHTLAKAEKITVNTTAPDEQKNIARLELQVALDTLVTDLQLVTILDIQEMVKAGKLTYAGLTQMYLTRIELYDNSLNKLNAVRALNPNALADAAARDTAFAQNPSVAKGMFGIPVMLKDNINFMGLPTTAGSIVLADNYTPYDAPLVTNLKTAGAIILGKLNMTEVANGVNLNASNANGFSSLGRRVYSAYRPNALTAHGSTLSRLDPSGSSSGSGVAASAALTTVAIGTETSGSIISPSQSSFLVGIKPTVGIISRYGVIPLNSLWDTTGPIVRNVTDAAILMNATYGYDPNDPETEGILKAGLTGFDFTECLKPGFLTGKRIGVMSLPAATAAARPAFDAALQAITAVGATLVYQTNGNVLPSIPNPTAPSSTNFRFKVDLAEYLATLNPNYKWYKKSIVDVYEYMRAEFQANPGLFRDHIGTSLNIDRIGEASSYVINEETLAEWAAHHSSDIRQLRDEGIDRRLRDYNLDGLVGSGNLTTITARASYPHITVPIFRTNSTQLTGSHMYFAGTAFSEPVLIAAAYVAEQATKARDNSAPGLGDKTVLGNTITTARALTSADVAKFQTIYDAAVAAYTSDFATQMDVDKANDALRTAMAYKYTVTFVDWDGKVLNTQAVEHGKSATAPPNPKREKYTFTGWDKNFSNVTEDMTVTAQYEKDEFEGCNAVGYGYLVFALFGIMPFVFKRKK
jgi:amidase